MSENFDTWTQQQERPRPTADAPYRLTGFSLAGLVDAFRRGSVDFVQDWHERRWGEIDDNNNDPLIHDIETHREP